VLLLELSGGKWVGGGHVEGGVRGVRVCLFDLVIVGDDGLFVRGRLPKGWQAADEEVLV
jgi:hypothetical protein